MAVDYRLLHHFERRLSMETALREAAAGVAARRLELAGAGDEEGDDSRPQVDGRAHGEELPQDGPAG